MGWKLRTMVAKGVVTPEQAREKMAAWMAKAAGKAPAFEGDTPSEAAAAWKKLRLMVAKGEITREQARERRSHMIPAWFAEATMAKEEITREMSIEEKTALMNLREMVAKGEITKREAVRKIRKLIGKDEITRDQARAKIAAWQASASALAPNAEDAAPSAETLLALKLDKLVAKGELTPEQARLKLVLRKKVMNGEINPEQAIAAWESSKAETMEDETSGTKDALASKLDKLVMKGEMTPEQARMKLAHPKMLTEKMAARAKMAALRAKAAGVVVV